MEGQIDVTELAYLPPSQREAAIKKSELISKLMSPPGELKLPPLLEQRRLQFGIIDDVFRTHCVYDRVFVWQLEPHYQGQKTFLTDGKIIMPETSKERRKQECPRGIVVSAGATALDRMRAHGMDLGHICTFVRLSPWRMPVAVVEGVETPVLVLRDGDLVSSEDLPQRLRNGARFEHDAELNQHVFIDESGKRWCAPAPQPSEEY